MGRTKNAPKTEQPDGWSTLRRERITKKQGVSLQKIECKGLPGTYFRLRTIARRGLSYDATLWSFKSNGIPRSFSLQGIDIGGHDVKEILVQIMDGNGDATLTLERFGD